MAHSSAGRRTLQIRTRARGTYDVSQSIADVVAASGVAEGMCHLFLRHTSASLIICENADPTVRSDLERFMAKLVPDGSQDFEHDAEGPDDMSAHVRTILTNPALAIPVSGGRLMLGTWQGIYLWEHRTQPQNREIVVTVVAL
jgi:secondary thiamine-phosphate synthase enzyme